jgi:hypothetical protein
MRKEKIKRVGVIIQRIIINIALFFIYYFVFGLTVIAAFLFNRKMLMGENNLKDTSWREVDGYEADARNSKMQS